MGLAFAGSLTMRVWNNQKLRENRESLQFNLLSPNEVFCAAILCSILCDSFQSMHRM